VDIYHPSAPTTCPTHPALLNSVLSTFLRHPRHFLHSVTQHQKPSTYVLPLIWQYETQHTAIYSSVYF